PDHAQRCSSPAKTRWGLGALGSKGGDTMSGPNQEFVELFLQEASEHLQFLREYSGILLDPYPMPDDIERLYISAHGISGTAGTYGYPQFAEVAGKLAHIFQIAISENGNEAADDILAFKQRYPFAFQAPAQAEAEPEPEPEPVPVQEAAP